MGRHRKPSTSSRSVARIAITGAVIGGGGLGMAAQANAATDSEWDVVARCESSGNWAINTGNGYQGGLQFAPSTWAGHGGTQFAAAAHLASRDQQIAIAEKVLATQGKGAWPVCGRGLSTATPRTLGSTPKPDAAPKDPASVTDAPAALADTPLAPLDNPAPLDKPAPLDAPAPLQPAVVPGPAELEIITISIKTPAADLVIVDAGWEAPNEDGVAHLASQRTLSS